MWCNIKPTNPCGNRVSDNRSVREGNVSNDVYGIPTPSGNNWRRLWRSKMAKRRRKWRTAHSII